MIMDDKNIKDNKDNNNDKDNEDNKAIDDNINKKKFVSHICALRDR